MLLDLLEAKKKLAILEGRTFFLKPLVSGDYSENYRLWLEDKEVNRFLETRFSIWDKERIIRFIEDQYSSETNILYGIFAKDTQTHIGNIKLGSINWYHLVADISYFIGDKEYRGRGAATEAVNLIVDYAKSINLHLLLAGLYGNNTPSMKVLEKAGFIRYGLLPEGVTDDVDGRVDKLFYYIKL